ncbi:MAG: hypothetical protein ABIH21_04045 [Patescibacteria group bacterium]
MIKLATTIFSLLVLMSGCATRNFNAKMHTEDFCSAYWIASHNSLDEEARRSGLLCVHDLLARDSEERYGSYQSRVYRMADIVERFGFHKTDRKIAHELYYYYDRRDRFEDAIRVVHESALEDYYVQSPYRGMIDECVFYDRRPGCVEKATELAKIEPEEAPEVMIYRRILSGEAYRLNRKFYENERFTIAGKFFVAHPFDFPGLPRDLIERYHALGNGFYLRELREEFGEHWLTFMYPAALHFYWEGMHREAYRYAATMADMYLVRGGSYPGGYNSYYGDRYQLPAARKAIEAALEKDSGLWMEALFVAREHVGLKRAVEVAAILVERAEKPDSWPTTLFKGAKLAQVYLKDRERAEKLARRAYVLLTDLEARKEANEPEHRDRVRLETHDYLKAAIIAQRFLSNDEMRAPAQMAYDTFMPHLPVPAALTAAQFSLGHERVETACAQINRETYRMNGSNPDDAYLDVLPHYDGTDQEDEYGIRPGEGFSRLNEACGQEVVQYAWAREDAGKPTPVHVDFGNPNEDGSLEVQINIP